LGIGYWVLGIGYWVLDDITNLKTVFFIADLLRGTQMTPIEQMKKTHFWAILFFIGYSGLLIWMGYRPLQRNLIDPGYEYYDLKTIKQDAPEFALPSYDDSGWSGQLAGHKGLWWLRAKVRLPEVADSFSQKGISIMLKGSYELYFKGILIGKNGLIDGAGKELQAGLYRRTFLIPDSVTAEAGFYPISLRIANDQASSAQLPYIRVGEYLQIARQPMALALFLHITAGIFLIAGIYFGGMYLLSYRQWEWLIFAGLCLSFFGLTILEYVKYYLDYVHTWQEPRLMIIQVLTFLAACLLPLYFLFHFQIKQKGKIFAVHLLILILIQWLLSGFDKPAYYMMMAAFITALGVILYALVQSKKNSRPALFSLLFFSICLLIYYDFNLFVGFTGVVAFGLLAMNRHIQVQKKLYEASLLKSSRLEVELLKKKIQPHFLMNTLTSLINMVEEEPQTGVKMIHALARLFRLLNDISPKQEIPVVQEIELCKTYLEIMEYQRESRFELNVSPIPAHQKLPPAILLTLIENGITHQKPINGRMNFRIDWQQQATQDIYTVKIEGKFRMSKNKLQEGIGLRYIKARLEEWRKGAWEMNHFTETNRYQTQLIIKKGHEHSDRRR
jgi:hypothetical protein